MHHVTRTVRSFAEMVEAQKIGEVTSDAVKKARRWLQESAHFDTSHTIDLWVLALSQIGFNNAKIEFNGFYCEGDGASFTCDTVNVGKLVSFLSTEREAKNRIEVVDGNEDFRSFLLSKAKMSGINSSSDFNWIAEHEDEFDAKVIRTNHYYKHSMTCAFVIWQSSTTSVAKLIGYTEESYVDFINRSQRLREALSDGIYEDLKADYDYLMSDESLVEIAANNYGFDEFGDFVKT